MMVYLIRSFPVFQGVAHITLNATENTCYVLQDLKTALLVFKVFTLFLYSLSHSVPYLHSNDLVYLIIAEFDVVTSVRYNHLCKV